MKIILTMIFISFAFGRLPAQEITEITGRSPICPEEENLIFRNQAGLDQYRQMYPNCDRLYNVTASGEDITSLDAFENVIMMESLHISLAPGLTDLSGLDTLGLVNFVTIRDCPGLLSLNGLESLKITSQINILRNESLLNIDALAGIISVWNLEITDNSSLVRLPQFANLGDFRGYIIIENNASLQNLDGLNQIYSIGNNLLIRYNEGLQSLHGLENLTNIGAILELAGNSSLKNLNGLNRLEETVTDLIIHECNQLSNLRGLESLTAVGGKLEITGNGRLNTLKGIDHINPGSIDRLVVKQNPLLYRCSIESVCNYLMIPESQSEIHENGQGCNNEAEVMEACTNPPAEWAPAGARWTYSFPYSYGNAMTYLTIESVGDTVIGNINCRILQQTCARLPDLNRFFYTTKNADSVWLYDGSNFRLLYDFSAESGSSWEIYGPHLWDFSHCDTLTTIIADSTGYENLNGEFCKYLYTNLPEHSWQFNLCNSSIEKISEKFGSYGYLIPQHLCMTDVPSPCELRCYEEPGSGLIKLTDYDSCTFENGVGIPETAINREVFVYPNPFTDVLNIRLTEPVKESRISLYAPDGRLLLTRLLNGNSTELILGNLKKGCYFCRIVHNGKISSTKLIKTN